MALGIGAMADMLFNPHTGEAELVKRIIGNEIESIKITKDNELVIKTMAKEVPDVQFTDEGQSCCERRYMDSDDDPDDFVGARIVDIELADGPDKEDEFGRVHEQQFLRIKTDRGVFVVANHNEHNGYYGGFELCCKEYTEKVYPTY